MNDDNYQPFNSIIEAKACNNNDRPVYLQYKPSNFKFSDGPKPEPNPKDKYTKIKVKYNATYAVDATTGTADPMPANTCEYFSVEKVIDPTQKK